MSMRDSMERMIQDVNQGKTVEESVKELEIGVKVETLRDWVRPVLTEAEQHRKGFAAVKSKQGLLQALEKLHGEDHDALFHRMSDVKYLVNSRNLKLSHDLLKGQGMDPEFMEASFSQAHEAEQQMTQVTGEELKALREELLECLPDEDENIFTLLRQGADTPEGEALLAQTEEAVQKATPQNREDFAVLVTAAYLKEHPEANPQEAAKAMATNTAYAPGQLFSWLMDGLDVSLGVLIGGAALSGLAELAGLSLLSSVGEVVAAGGAYFVALFATLAVGTAAAVGIQKLMPYVKKFLGKCTYHIAKLADRVKTASLKLFGVVRDHVFRPAIHWTANTAVPAIREHVVYPLKRRLVRFLDWIREKWDQTVAFFRSATSAEAEVEDDGAFSYSCQPVKEGEREPLYT